MIRLTIPSIDEDDVSAVADVLRTGHLVQGARVAEFERVFAEYVGTRHAVATTNCTEALFLSLSALGIGAGDKVATCTYSWPATANAIVLCGAEPVFVDIEATGFNMDPQRLSDALEKHRVKAIIPVDTFGGPAEMATLEAIAERHGAALVEDAACALGTESKGRRAGAFGKVGCFSLHPRKAITTGEGGMMTTDDDALVDRLRVLRNHGMATQPAVSAGGVPRPDFIAVGHNLRMTEFQAALGLTQFKKLERIIGARRSGAARYDGLLAGTSIRPPASAPGAEGRHVYQSYVVLLPASAVGRRDAIIGFMRERGIETTLGTYHMPLTTYYSQRFGFRRGDFPVTDDVTERTLTLPLYEGLDEATQGTVVTTLREALAAVTA